MHTGCAKNLMVILLIFAGWQALTNVPPSVISAIPTATREPTEDRPLPESSILISPTPWPTADALLPDVQAVLSANADCILPCITGLRVGESNIDDFRALIRQIDPTNAVSMFEYGDTGGSYVLFFSEGLWATDFSIDNSGVLERLRINIIRPNQWLPESLFDLPNVITQLGVPDGVFISFAAFGGPPLHSYLILVYEEERILINYEMRFTNEQAIGYDQPKPICFVSDFSVFVNLTVWIQSPDYPGQVTDEIPNLGLEDNSRPRQAWSLETMTGLTEEQFAEVFRENPAGCIYTLSSKELRDRGYGF